MSRDHQVKRCSPFVPFGSVPSHEREREGEILKIAGVLAKTKS